jgi:hypothetical protein
MSWGPTARLAVIVGAGVVLAAATYAEAGPRSRGNYGLRRSSNFHQRFYQARSDLRSRNGYATSRHLGFSRHQGPGDGYSVICNPPRYWNAVRPCYVTPYRSDYGYGYGYGRGYGYGYGYWITVGAEDYHRTSEPPVFAVVSTQRADAPPPDPIPTRSETAWDLLADDEAQAALSEFAVLTLRASGDAQARAGYGLAAAMLGKHDTAVWAFRRAVTADADVLDDLAGDERLTEPLKMILDEYARELQGDEVEAARKTGEPATKN